MAMVNTIPNLISEEIPRPGGCPCPPAPHAQGAPAASDNFNNLRPGTDRLMRLGTGARTPFNPAPSMPSTDNLANSRPVNRPMRGPLCVRVAKGAEK